jgi:DNA polymerase sigma
LIDVDSVRNPCKVAAGNLVTKPYINWAVKRVTRCLQVLWPRSRTNLFGSNATGLALPTSDVDLVVSLPPVRNLVSCMTINDFQHGSSNAVVFLLS